MYKMSLKILVAATVFINFGLCQAVDKKVYSVADGMNDRYNRYEDGTGRTMWADNSSAAGTVRRSLIKFSTSSINGSELRGAVLNLWGGRSSSSGVPTLKIYHYSYDGWSDSSVPYAFSLGALLATVQVPEVLDGYYPNRNKYAFSVGNNLPYDNDGYLSMAMVATGGSAVFYTRNTVTWDGSKGLEPYLTFRSWSNTTLINSNFTSSLTTSDWNVNSGGGTASVVNYGGDSVAQLTTGSPVGISQYIDTPKDAFYILFDYMFKTDTGTLSVTLTDRNGVKEVVGQLNAEALIGDSMAKAAFHVDAPSWLYLDNVAIGFEFDGVTGSQILLDNVEISDVPEPTTLALLVLGSLAILKNKK